MYNRNRILNKRADNEAMLTSFAGLFIFMQAVATRSMLRL